MKNKILGNSGLVIITTLSIIPILLWLPSNRSGFNLRSLSQIAALTGTVLFSINFVLSTRQKYLEHFFNGLNRIYIIHHLVGQVSFILLLFHPVILGVFYLKISMEAAFSILFPPISEFATWLGLSSLLSFVILLILTLFIKLPYNIWKTTHKLLGVSLFLASIHIFFINSTVATNLPLRYYMLGICFTGLLSYFYKTLFGRIFVRRFKFKVEDVRVIENITNITMSLLTGEKEFKYQPGQFVFIRFDSLGITSEEHPFSLTSSPDEKLISISAKSSGDYTETIKLLKKDTLAIVDGAYGRFSYQQMRKQSQIWIAGGIGITPFVSMAKSLKNEKDYNVVLFYIVKNHTDAIFFDLLHQLTQELPNFLLIVFETKEKGHLTADLITQKVEDYKERSILVCGPPTMMKTLRKQFNNLGVRNSNIVSEEFSID